ncbi:hypothetical protein GW17_00029380 [Ensete ventricosum]|nr:hypothetical protein GW17_00029380 [Ensete ventricosum]
MIEGQTSYIARIVKGFFRILDKSTAYVSGLPMGLCPQKIAPIGNPYCSLAAPIRGLAVGSDPYKRSGHPCKGLGRGRPPQ